LSDSAWRSQFFGRLAHDLRSPLNVVGGAFDDLQAGDVSAEDRDHSAALGRRSVQRLLRLSERLQLAARLEQGNLAVDRRALDVVPVVRQAIERVTTLEPRKGVGAALDGPAHLQLEADPALLAIVVAELVGNATKHARAHVKVLLTAESLTVEDDGEGVAPAKAPQLFEAFVPRERHSGLGLGLWLARGLAQAQGHGLSVDPSRSNRFVLRWRP
jgi:two-component system sensor histidine kinase QseC